MRILMVTSEAVPFAKTGGLADVCGTLPAALASRGHDVRLVMPRYRQVDRAGLGPLEGPLGVPTGAGERWCLVLEGRLPRSDVPVYFLEHDALFDREEIYGPPGGSYGDNCLRFTVLARGAMQLCHKVGFYPEVVQCHDWQAALVPAFLRSAEQAGPLEGTASVLTIHNVAYQGRFGGWEVMLTGLGPEHFTVDELEFHGGLNLLKGGIANAAAVSTVSPTYAREITTPEHGEGLDGVLRARGEPIRGILNGIEEDFWNPETDSLLPERFGRTDLTGKAVCKRALQQRFGLPVDSSAPVVGFVGRLVEQKGVDLLAEAAPEIAAMGAQLVVLGSGAPEHEARLSALASESPAVGVWLGYDDALSHLLYAGCDLLVMPSRFEPCGLSQLYAMRYGTLPVVRAVGGLADSVADPSEGPGATGWKVHEGTARAMAEGVRRALALREESPAAFSEMIDAAMARQSGWGPAAAECETLFDEACKRRG